MQKLLVGVALEEVKAWGEYIPDIMHETFGPHPLSIKLRPFWALTLLLVRVFGCINAAKTHIQGAPLEPLSFLRHWVV